MRKSKMNNFGDMIYVDSIYRPAIGSFGKPRSYNDGRYVVSTWYNCREIWHNQMHNAKIFFYSHPVARNKSISVFFDKIEEKLNLDRRTIFGPTQKKSILYVKPSKWWLRYAMRRSLFTILMRSSCSFDIGLNNFKEALFSDSYALKSKTAIEYFLNGNTVYTGKKRGWYKQFGDKEINDLILSQLLVPEMKSTQKT
jgi:hypothetical protein